MATRIDTTGDLFAQVESAEAPPAPPKRRRGKGKKVKQPTELQRRLAHAYLVEEKSQYQVATEYGVKNHNVVRAVKLCGGVMRGRNCRRTNNDDMIGEKTETWTVSHFLRLQDQERYWCLRCVCGAETEATTSNINAGKVPYCISEECRLRRIHAASESAIEPKVQFIMSVAELIGADGKPIYPKIDTLQAAQPHGAPQLGGVYRIFCIVEGKFYIGGAWDFRDRWYRHNGQLRNKDHHAPRLQEAWDKYGAEAFVFEVIELVQLQDVQAREDWHIKTTKCADPAIGYNQANTAFNVGPHGARKIPKSEYPIIAKRYKAETTQQIATSYGVSKRCIGIILKKMNVPRRKAAPPKKYDLDMEQIASRFLAGESDNQIAKSLGVPRFIINAALTKAGKRRGKAGRAELSERRFWEKVQQAEGCWSWTGGVDGKGIPVWKKGDDRICRVKDVLWERLIGPIPEGQVLIPNCPDGHNKACVNPHHYKLGTVHERSVYFGQIGNDQRKPYGWQMKLTEERVREIRRLHATGEYTFDQLGTMFSVNPSTISQVVKRKTWTHVE